MGKITSVKKRRAEILFHDFSIRIFVDYKGNYCSGVRIWKLPTRWTFLHMFNTKNLVWAHYGYEAKVIHGFYTPSPITQSMDKRHWLLALSEQISQCNGYGEIIDLLSDIESMITNIQFLMKKD